MGRREKGGVAQHSAPDNGTFPIPSTMAYQVPNHPRVTCMLRTPSGAPLSTCTHAHAPTGPRGCQDTFLQQLLLLSIASEAKPA